MANYTAERWAPVPGYDGYEVSDQGRVRSIPRPGRRLQGKILKPFSSTQGYPTVSLRTNGATKRMTVHRIVAITFLGHAPAPLQVRHLNGNKLDSRLVNLAWGTPSENIYDKHAHGTDHQLNKTHCPQGHAYTPDNTYCPPARKGAARYCRTCMRIRSSNFDHTRAARRARAERRLKASEAA